MYNKCYLIKDLLNIKGMHGHSNLHHIDEYEVNRTAREAEKQKLIKFITSKNY